MRNIMEQFFLLKKNLKLMEDMSYKISFHVEIFVKSLTKYPTNMVILKFLHINVICINKYKGD